MLKKARPQFLMIFFSLASMLILLLGACGAPQSSGSSAPQASGGSPVKGGTWIDDLYEEPDSLLPNASTETFAYMMDQALYTPLFVGDPQNQIHPALATEVPTLTNGGISADSKTWTFHLRKGVTWSDGEPLDARDVAYSVKTWNNPKYGTANTVGFNLITGTKVSDDNLSITFTLKQAFAPFVSIWADGNVAPMPAHKFSSTAVDAITKSPDNLNPSVVSGPFMMKESKPGDHYTLVRNPKYYQAADGLPYLDSVIFRIVPDQNTILKDLQAGTADSSWFLDVSKTPAYKNLTNYTLTQSPTLTNFEAMYFNFNNKTLGQNRDVRQAISMSIDHQALINVARRGFATPLCTDHASGYKPGYQADASCPKYDAAAANQLLDQGGWTKGSDGVRSKNGQRLEFMYSSTANNPWRAADELIIQNNLKAIGVKVNIQNYPASTFFGPFLNDGKAGKYDIGEWETGFSYDPDDASLAACDQIPPNGSNFMFYCNKSLDTLYTQEQSNADPTQRQQVFNQIHQIYLTEVPFVTLYAPPDLAIYKNGTHNYVPGPSGASETVQIWKWWCEGGKCPA
jgi:peptide/nickel transport system substrate-binding protein